MDMNVSQKLNMWKDAYNEVPCGIVAFYLDDLSVIYANDMYYDMFSGIDKDSLYIPEDKREWFLKEISEQFSHEDDAMIDCELDSEKWIRMIASEEKGESESVIFAVLFDVSDRYRSIKILTKKKEELREKVEKDPLSKVYNRSAAIEKINHFIRHEDYSNSALVVLDIDNFKIINDTYGHLYGDAVITMVANCIKKVVSEEDIVGRFGGDEFFVFIKNNTKEELEVILKQMNELILALRSDINDDKDISASIGVSITDDVKGSEKIDFEAFFAHSDKALYVAKYNGKNRFMFYNHEKMKHINARGIGYSENKSEEYVTTTARDIVSLAVEILAKSKNNDNAVHNIMRHVGLEFDIETVQIMKLDCSEDTVTIEYEWHAMTNTAMKGYKFGYYRHNDIDCFVKRFQDKGHFAIPGEDTSDFSLKMQREFAKVVENGVLYVADGEGSQFYMIVYHSSDGTRKWKKEELDVLMEVTRMLSVFLKKNEHVSEKEKYLNHQLNYSRTTGLYNINVFNNHASRVKERAIEMDNDFVVAHIEFVDFYKFFEKYSLGRGLVDVMEKFGLFIRGRFNTEITVAADLPTTECFIMATRFLREYNIRDFFQDLIDDFFEEYLGQYKDDPIYIHIGVTHLPEDGSINAAIYNARALKRRITERNKNVIIIDSELK